MTTALYDSSAMKYLPIGAQRFHAAAADAIRNEYPPVCEPFGSVVFKLLSL